MSIRIYTYIVLLISVFIPVSLFGEESPGSGMNTSGAVLDIENAQVLEIETDIVPGRIQAVLNEGAPTWYIRDGKGQYRRLQLIENEIVSDQVSALPTEMILDDHEPPEQGDNRIWQFSGGSLTINRQNRFILRKLDGRVMARGQTIPDTKPVFTDGYLALLTEPSNAYRHGILGDTEESRSFIVYETGEDRIFTPDPLPAGTVFETRYPIWADVDEDGNPELLVTASNAEVGASIQVYGRNATLIAVSPPIGQGHRWLHLLGAFPTGPDGKTEIIAVRTPHIGGVLEFYRMNGATLEKEHTASGFSTHQIGSRNLDMAAVGRFGPEGSPAVLLPVRDYSRLILYQRENSRSHVLRQFNLDGRLNTNIELLDYNNALIIAWGTDKGIITILKGER